MTEGKPRGSRSIREKRGRATKKGDWEGDENSTGNLKKMNRTVKKGKGHDAYTSLNSNFGQGKKKQGKLMKK